MQLLGKELDKEFSISFENINPYQRTLPGDFLEVRVSCWRSKKPLCHEDELNEWEKECVLVLQNRQSIQRPEMERHHCHRASVGRGNNKGGSDVSGRLKVNSWRAASDERRSVWDKRHTNPFIMPLTAGPLHQDHRITHSCLKVKCFIFSLTALRIGNNITWVRGGRGVKTHKAGPSNYKCSHFPSMTSWVANKQS